MIDSDLQTNTNLKDWSIVSVSGKQVDIQLNFDRPLLVSQNKPDKIYFRIRMSIWMTSDQKSLPDLVVEKKEIVR